MSEQHRQTFDGFSDSVVVGGLTERLIWNNDVPFNEHISPKRNDAVIKSNGGTPTRINPRRLRLDFSPGRGVASRGYSEHAAQISGSLPPSRVKEYRLSRRTSENKKYMAGFDLSSLFTTKSFRAQTSPVPKRKNRRIPPTSHSLDEYQKMARRFSTGSYPLPEMEFGFEDIFTKNDTIANLDHSLPEPIYESEICSNAQFRENEIVMNVLQNSHPKALRQFLLSVPDVAVKSLLFESPKPTGCFYLSKQILGYLVGPLNTENPMTDDQRLRLLYIAGKQAQILVRSSVFTHYCDEKGKKRWKRCNCLEDNYQTKKGAFPIAPAKSRRLANPDKRRRQVTKNELPGRTECARPTAIDLPVKSASDIMLAIPKPLEEKSSPPTNINKSKKSNTTSRTKLDSSSEVPSISMSRQPTTLQNSYSSASVITVDLPVIDSSDNTGNQPLTPIGTRENKLEEIQGIKKRSHTTLPLSGIGFGKKIDFSNRPVIPKKIPQPEKLNKPLSKFRNASAICYKDLNIKKPRCKEKIENVPPVQEIILREVVTKEESLRLWTSWLLPPQTFISRETLP